MVSDARPKKLSYFLGTGSDGTTRGRTDASSDAHAKSQLRDGCSRAPEPPLNPSPARASAAARARTTAAGRGLLRPGGVRGLEAFGEGGRAEATVAAARTGTDPSPASTIDTFSTKFFEHPNSVALVPLFLCRDP